MPNGNPAPGPLNSRYFRPVCRKETRARRWDLQFESTSLQRRVRANLTPVITWCRDHDLEVTRSRAYRKNDQAWVEQKNGAIDAGRVAFAGHSRPGGEQIRIGSRVAVMTVPPALRPHDRAPRHRRPPPITFHQRRCGAAIDPRPRRRGHRMNRRELLLMLGGGMTAARTLRAQQKAMPVIG
jgi:hypothetical protein